MSRPNRTRSALLGFLSWGPMSGYDLRRVIEGSISSFWSESYGRIYPMLAQLADDGLATRKEAPSDGGRPRNVYSLTEAGRSVLGEWLEESGTPNQPPRNERLLKLFFGARTSLENSIRLVEEYREELLGTREYYAETRERLESAPNVPPDQQYWLMTLRFGELQVEAHLSWCVEIAAQLEELRQRQTGATAQTKLEETPE